MRSPAVRKERSPAATRTGKYASLSVVVVSSGPAVVAQRAAQALKAASRDFATQLIVVALNEDPNFPSTLEKSGVEFVAAPPGSSRAEMCDLGMSCATGSIVAVRDDITVGDAQWLNAYRGVLPTRADTVPSPHIESVVMDTLVARRVAMSDSAPSSSTTETKERSAAIEMAAAG